MKQALLLISLSVATYAAVSQTSDTLRVYWNKQLLLSQNSMGGKDSPLAVIKKEWLQKNAVLEIHLHAKDKMNHWKRFFQFTDTVNNIFMQREFTYTRGHYVFSTSAIQLFFKKHKNLLLYSFQQPPETARQNTGKIERYLLCKLIVE